jgi:hypothetical protein
MRIYDIAKAIQMGQNYFASFVKTPSQTTGAGIWFDLAMSPGNPIPLYYFSTPLVAQALYRSTDGGLDHGSDKPGFKKLLWKMLFQEVGTTACPLPLQLLDYLMYYPGIAMDPGVQTLINNIALPRQDAIPGEGVRIIAIEQMSYVGNATFQLTYTNSNGVAGRQTPICKCNTQTVPGTISTSATATAQCFGRFIPLASGDTGVRSIEQIEFFVGDVGLLVLVLVVPLVRFCIFENTAPTEFDLVKAGHLIPIKDDAYLNFIAKPPGSLAASPIAGDISTLWSV